MISAAESTRLKIELDNNNAKINLSDSIDELKVLEKAQEISEQIMSPIVEEGKTASTLEIELKAEKSAAGFFIREDKDVKAANIKKEQIILYLNDEFTTNEDFKSIINIQEYFEYIKLSTKAYELIRGESLGNSSNEFSTDELARSAYIRELILGFVIKISMVTDKDDSSQLHEILREEIKSKGLRLIDLHNQKADIEKSIKAFEDEIDSDLQRLGERVTDTLVISKLITSVGKYDMRMIGDAYFKQFYSTVVETGFNGFLKYLSTLFGNIISKKPKSESSITSVKRNLSTTVPVKPQIVSDVLKKR